MFSFGGGPGRVALGMDKALGVVLFSVLGALLASSLMGFFWLIGSVRNPDAAPLIVAAGGVFGAVSGWIATTSAR